MSTDTDYAYLAKLHQLISQTFDKDDLHTLCFTLGLDYEELPGERKSTKVRELLQAVVKTGRLPELLNVVQQRRPHLAWPPIPDDFQAGLFSDSEMDWPEPPAQQPRSRGSFWLLLVMLIVIGLFIVYQIVLNLTPLGESPLSKIEASLTSTPTSSPEPTETLSPTPLLEEETTEEVVATILPTDLPTPTLLPATPTETATSRAIPAATPAQRCTLVTVEILPEGVDGKQARFSWSPLQNADYYKLYVIGNRADNPNAILKDGEVIDQTQFVIPDSGFVNTFFELDTDYRYTLQAFTAPSTLICESEGTFRR
jgi:hypothetical protein